jgi:RNA polymerase sigma-70 factor, ECF subfamily
VTHITYFYIKKLRNYEIGRNTLLVTPDMWWLYSFPMRPELEQAVELLQRHKSRDDERALALIQATVFNFSMKVCGHREDAEDTMQEVLLKSLRYLPGFDSPKALAVWLYKVARNNCLMKRRRSKFAPKENLSLEELMPDAAELKALATDQGSTPEAQTLRGEQAEILRKAVLKVPPQYRLVLVLHDMEGVESAEIARILDIREGAVRVRLHRARLFVRKELAKTAKSNRHEPSTATVARPRRCKEMFAALSDYMDGALDDSMCDELEKHLNGCVPCEGFLASLERTVAQCRSLKTGCRSKSAGKVRKKLLTEYKRVLEAIAERRQSAASAS